MNLLLSIYFLLLLLPSNTKAQENKRSNFCPLHQQVERNEVDRENALSGKTISIGIAFEIDEANPYIAIRMLNEVARRAGFNYTAYVTGPPLTNETWTDLLIRQTTSYDLAVDWWMVTVSRLSQGVIYPESWYNADTILIMRESQRDDAFVFWAFSFPFSPGLWVLTVLTIIFTGLLYYFLDFLHAKADRSKMALNVEGSIFTSFYCYTGSRSVFAPKSTSTRVLVVSMAFLYLILISAYTANLTNFYIIKSRSEIQVNDISDVIRHDLLLCVVRGYGSTEALYSKHSNIRTLEVESEPLLLTAVSNGECDVGMISIEGYQTYKRDVRYNSNCDLEWVGRRVILSRAGFALGDSEGLCTSLLDNILDYHLVQMKNDGVVEDIMQLNREAMAENTCTTQTKTQDSNDTSLTVLNMGGAFALHLCCIIISILLGFYEYFYQSKEIKHHVKENLKSSFRRTISSTSSNFTREKPVSSSSRNTFQNNIVFAQEQGNSTNPVFENQKLILKLLEKVSEQDEKLATQKLELLQIKTHLKQQ